MPKSEEQQQKGQQILGRESRTHGITTYDQKQHNTRLKLDTKHH